MKSQYEAVGYCIAVCQMMGIQSQYLTDHFGKLSGSKASGRTESVPFELKPASFSQRPPQPDTSPKPPGDAS